MRGTALVCSTKFSQLRIHEVKIINRKVASTSPSNFEAHAGLFRLPMKGIFDAYVLRPFGKKFIFELVASVRTREFTVSRNKFSGNYSVKTA